jgi:predicted transcriptional regulator
MPSISTPRLVVSCSSEDSILDTMELMNSEGVNSVAVVDSTTGALLSAVSVTDVGKVSQRSARATVVYMQKFIGSRSLGG